MRLLREVSTIAWLDVTDFWRVRWVIVGFFSLHLAEALVMIVVLDRLVPIDYIRFALPGIAVSAAALAGFDQGRRVFWELQSRTDHYLRSLPLNRKVIPLARIAAAAVKAPAYAVWLLVLLMIVAGAPGLRIFPAILAIFALGAGLGAAGIGLGAVIGDFHAWSATASLFTLTLVATSSAFYPTATLSAVHRFLGWIALSNPLTGGSDLLRWAIGSSNVSPLPALFRLLLPVGVLIPLGSILYYRALARD